MARLTLRHTTGESLSFGWLHGTGTTTPLRPHMAWLPLVRRSSKPARLSIPWASRCVGVQVALSLPTPLLRVLQVGGAVEELLDRAIRQLQVAG